MAFQDLGFLERQETSTKISYQIMEYLFEKKYINAFRKTDKKTDIDGVDYEVQWSSCDSFKNVQFKNRQDKWKDLPVTRFQPFYGVDCDRTVLGRDYKSLTLKKNEYYLVATQNSKKKYDQVSVTCTQKILQLILDAEKEWFGEMQPYAYFTNEKFQEFFSKDIRNKKIHVASNGVEAWYKKNFRENYGKINVYVPCKYIDKLIPLV